ncbi:MAG: hypothetical protein GY827_11990 [Cytophagales bacterium]|nr:hypothetical protein [Cytophagales bacterium]
MKNTAFLLTILISYLSFAQTNTQGEALQQLTKAFNDNNVELLKSIIPSSNIFEECSELSIKYTDKHFEENIIFDFKNFKTSCTEIKLDTLIISSNRKTLKHTCTSNQSISHIRLIVSNDSQDHRTIVGGVIELIKFKDKYYIEGFDLKGVPSSSHTAQKRKFIQEQKGQPIANLILKAIQTNDLSQLKKQVIPLELMKVRMLACNPSSSQITDEQLAKYYEAKIVGKIANRLQKALKLAPNILSLGSCESVRESYPDCYQKDFSFRYNCSDGKDSFELYFILVYDSGNYFLAKVNFQKVEESFEEEAE